MDTNTLRAILLIIMTIIFLSFWLYRLIEDLNKKIAGRFIELKASLDHDSKQIEKKRIEMWNEISLLQRILFKPLYKEGETVYFTNPTLESCVSESSAKIIEVISKCGEMPCYKVLLNKEEKIISQDQITAWK